MAPGPDPDHGPWPLAPTLKAPSASSQASPRDPGPPRGPPQVTEGGKKLSDFFLQLADKKLAVELSLGVAPDGTRALAGWRCWLRPGSGTEVGVGSRHEGWLVRAPVGAAGAAPTAHPAQRPNAAA